MRFVLVHGGFQGAWVWDKVIPELKLLGHGAVAVDLPGHGTRRNETATLQGYRDTVVDAMHEDDVLVGHSMGGFVVTVAADAAPEKVKHIVYLAAGVPVEGLSMSETTGGNVGSTRGSGKDIMWGGISSYVTFEPEGYFSIPTLEAVTHCFFHDCPPDIAKWGFEKSVPQSLVPPTTPIHVPRFWRAQLPRSFILCTEDRALDAELAQVFIDRLNVEPLKIRASHSPFLSRPRETAELLIQAVGTKPLGPLRPTIT